MIKAKRIAALAAIAGVVLATTSAAWAFAINAASFLPLIYVLAIIKIEEKKRRTGEPGGFIAQLVEGLAPNFVAAAMPHIEGAAAYWRSQIGEGGEEATVCAPACATFPGSAALGSHEIPDPKPAKGA